MASQLEYNEGKLDGIAKGQFEQKAIDKISDDMFSVVDNTENSQIYKDYGTEYSFLINQLNSQGKEIKTLQDQLGQEQDPTRKELIVEQIKELMDEGAEYVKETPNNTGGVDRKKFEYGSFQDMQERFGKLNSLPEFKNYQRAINVLNHLRAVSYTHLTLPTKA